VSVSKTFTGGAVGRRVRIGGVNMHQLLSALYFFRESAISCGVNPPTNTALLLSIQYSLTLTAFIRSWHSFI